MSEQQEQQHEVKEVEVPKPGEFLGRLKAGIDLGRTLGAGTGKVTPRGATVDQDTGEVVPPPKTAPKEEPKEEPEQPEEEKEQSETLAAIDRMQSYLGRLRRKVQS